MFFNGTKKPWRHLGACWHLSRSAGLTNFYNSIKKRQRTIKDIQFKISFRLIWMKTCDEIHRQKKFEETIFFLRKKTMVQKINLACWSLRVLLPRSWLPWNRSRHPRTPERSSCSSRSQIPAGGIVFCIFTAAKNRLRVSKRPLSQKSSATSQVNWSFKVLC